jgi:hypothetical protein
MLSLQRSCIILYFVKLGVRKQGENFQKKRYFDRLAHVYI